MKRFYLNQAAIISITYSDNIANGYQFNSKNKIIAFFRIKIKNPLKAKESILKVKELLK